MIIQNRMMRAGLLLLGLFALPCLGQVNPGAAKEPDPKVTEAAGRIGPALDAVLAEVNAFKTPSPDGLSSGQAVLSETKRYFLQMDDKQKAQYCLLQSWLSYYTGQIQPAYMSAAKACKLDAASGDAWTTQIILSLMMEKKPMLPKIPRSVNGRSQQGNKPARSPRKQAQREDAESTEGRDPQVSVQKGVLDFDPLQFQIEAFGKSIKSLTLQNDQDQSATRPVDGKILCVLVWRKHETESPAPAGVKPAPGVAQDTPGPVLSEQTATTHEASVGAFEKLYTMGKMSTDVKFLAVNVDSSRHKEEILGDINKASHPWLEMLTADQDKKPLAEVEPMLRAVMPSRPLLLMTDPNGVICYAGPAGGIVAPMLLSHIASVKLIAAESTRESTTGIDPRALESPVTDGNSISVRDIRSLSAADSNSVSKPAPAPKSIERPAEQSVQQAKQPAAQPAQPYKELSEEDKIQAEQKLAYARDLYMKLGKKPGLNYREGVKLCREIMQKYPGSEYANNAQQLLREVPERERPQYGITDEELGL